MQEPTQADFTKTLAVVLLAEYLVVAVAHAASIALTDGPATIALCARVAAWWLFAGLLVINVATVAGALSMRRTEFAPFAKMSYTMTGAFACILVASWLNERLVFHAGAAALTAVMLLATLVFADGKFLKPTPR
jgi:hypothetical protein